MSYPSGPSNPNLGAMAPPEKSKKRFGRSKDNKTQDKKTKKTTKRVVDKQIMFAALFAVIIAAGGWLYLNQPVSGQYVVRAKADIPALTPMSMDLVQADFIPTAGVEPSSMHADNAQAALEQATTAFASTPRSKFTIRAQEQIALDDFGADLTLDKPLVDGERLVSISASVVNGVAGQIKPGDIVDILGTANNPETGQKVTGILASNVPVVSVTVTEDLYRKAGAEQAAGTTGTEVTTLLPADPISPGIYVVRVPADVTMNLAAVQNDGTLTLLYRGAESGDMEPDALTSFQALCKASPSSPSCLGMQ